jgi:uncharacterized protein YciI
LVAFALSVLACCGCSTTRPNPQPRGYTLVLLKTGPADAEVTGDERKAAFAGHMANIGSMAERHQLVVAGPFGKTRHDPLLRGLLVMHTSDRAQAIEWASTDPTAKRGVFVLEYHDLATDAALVQGLERALASEAADKAAGRTPNLEQLMRGYVLLTAEHGDLARRELAPLVESGGVYVLGVLDEVRALAWLDARDVAAAEARYADVLARIGPYTLDDWFGSIELSRLRAP